MSEVMITKPFIKRHGRYGLVEKSPQWTRAAKVLMIDDDMESILAIETIFRQFGCYITYATEEKEASKYISSGKADIIILDWMLNKGTLIYKSLRTIKKFKSLRHKFLFNRPLIITYSTLNRDRLCLPETNFFTHIDHWKKPLSYKEILTKTSALLNYYGF